MKKCFKCCEDKPLNEFYAHPQMADGHLNKCKSCTKVDTASRVERMEKDPKWAAKERSRHRIKSRAYRSEGRAAIPSREQNHARNVGYATSHPEKRAAQLAVGRAVRSGALVRLPCEKCGDPKSQGHHDDYSKPLDVRWLCVTHHAEHHVAVRERVILKETVV